MHICGIYKNGNADLICEAERDTDREDKYMDTRGKERWEELGDWGWHIYSKRSLAGYIPRGQTQPSDSALTHKIDN